MFGLSKLQRLGVAALIFAVSLAGVYFYGRSVGVESEQNRQAVAIAKAQKTAAGKEAADRAIGAVIERPVLEARREDPERIRQLENDLHNAMRAQSECLRNARRSVSSTSPAPSVIDAEAARERSDRGNAPDISQDLASFAGRCEDDRRTLIALQEWVTATR